ncbi:MAG: hypothetical protein VX178_10445, partial [Pseudomonadota bacterium]|nr:hypothetical protein [Pseudomonadota bacterium]
MIEARIVATMNVTHTIALLLNKREVPGKKVSFKSIRKHLPVPLLYGAQMVVATPLYRISRDRPDA